MANFTRDGSARRHDYPAVVVAGEQESVQDGVRIIELGSGLPTARRGQAAAGWLVQIGDGDVFAFDAGPGSPSSFCQVEVPFWRADKIFLTHLPMDNVGDVVPAYDSGHMFAWPRPLQIYAPVGPENDLSIERLIECVHDLAALRNAPERPRFEITPHGLSPDGTQLIYSHNDVEIYSYPVPNGVRGAVGYRLDYGGAAAFHTPAD